jgi:hypothetical protein
MFFVIELKFVLGKMREASYAQLFSELFCKHSSDW